MTNNAFRDSSATIRDAGMPKRATEFGIERRVAERFRVRKIQCDGL